MSISEELQECHHWLQAINRGDYLEVVDSISRDKLETMIKHRLHFLQDLMRNEQELAKNQRGVIGGK